MTEPIKKTDGYGEIQYQLDGKLHRTDGPAVEHIDGSKFWYINGILHRDDGSAIECLDGSKYWYASGRKVTVENHRNFINDYPDLVNQFLAYQVLNG